jgi:hypothetical protein
VDKKLIEFAHLIRQPGTDAERYLRLQNFVDARDRKSSWYTKLPKEEKELWAEARAVITVSLAMAYSALSMSEEKKKEFFPKGNCPFRWAEIESLASELLGKKPNKSRERWLTGVKERVLWGLKSKGEPWTKAHAREICAGLRRSRGEYRKEYKEIADWAEREGV